MLASSPLISFVPSKDLAKARKFYEQTLGLAFIKDDGFAHVYRVESRMLRVVDVSRVPDFQPAPFSILGWDVADIRTVVAGLAERGVGFERYPWFQQDELGIWTAPGGDEVAWFKDPDGNVLSVASHA